MRWNERWYLFFLGNHQIRGLPKQSLWLHQSILDMSFPLDIGNRHVEYHRGKQGGPTKWPWSALEYDCLMIFDVKQLGPNISPVFTQQWPLQRFWEVGWSSNLIESQEVISNFPLLCDFYCDFSPLSQNLIKILPVIESGNGKAKPLRYSHQQLHGN